MLIKGKLAMYNVVPFTDGYGTASPKVYRMEWETRKWKVSLNRLFRKENPEERQVYCGTYDKFRRMLDDVDLYAPKDFENWFKTTIEAYEDYLEAWEQNG